MAQNIINIGAAPNDNTGDDARTSFSKVNANFSELYQKDVDLQTAIDHIEYGGLVGKPVLGSAASRDVGTSSGNLVEVQAGGKLPALDGSQLINVSGGGGGGSIDTEGVPTVNQFAQWVDGNTLKGVQIKASDIEDLASATGIPVGGSANQILAKKTGSDFDTEWTDSPTSLPPGGVSGQILTKDSGTDGDASWHSPTALGGDVVGPASSVSGRAAIFSGTTGKLLAQSAAAPVLEGDTRLTNARTPLAHTHTFSEVSGVASSTQGAKADTALQSSTLLSTIQDLAGVTTTPESDFQVIMINPGSPDQFARVLLTTTQFAALVEAGMTAQLLGDRIAFLESMGAVHKDTGFSASGQVVTTTGITHEVTSNVADDVAATVADVMTANPGFIPDCEVQAATFAPTNLTITSGALTFDAAETTLTCVGTAITAENVTISNAIWTNMLPGVPYTLYLKQPSSAVTVSWNSTGITMKHFNALGSYQINNALLAWVLKKVTIGGTTYCTTSYFGDVS
jgi:hypothetical protein